MRMVREGWVGRWNGRRERGLRRKGDPRGMDEERVWSLGRGVGWDGVVGKDEKEGREDERTVKSRRGKEEGVG